MRIAPLLLLLAITPAAGAPGVATAVQLEMANVDFHIDTGIVLRIKRLRGALIPTSTDQPPALDDKKSYTLSIESAEIAIDTASLGVLLNRHVFGYPGAPLKKVQVSMDGDQLIESGVMHKGLDMSFRIHSTVGLTADGQIQLHPTSVKVAGGNAAGLMKLFGLHLGSMIKLQPGHGARIERDDIILDPVGMLPPPAIRGRLTAIRIENQRLVQTFGIAGGKESAPLRRPDRSAPNYMYFQGGTLRFGKLTMANTDMELIDNDPSDPFDLSLDRYNDQLVAGYSRNTASHGLIVHMPDFRALKAGAVKIPKGN